MNRLTYTLFCFISAMFFTAVTLPAFADGSGSWGDDSGFTGNGGGFGGSGSGGDWGDQCQSYISSSKSQTLSSSPAAACSAYVGVRVASDSVIASTSLSGLTCSYETKHPTTGVINGSGSVKITVSNCLDEPICPAGEELINGVCTPPLKCPAGYIKQDNKCIWQCPAGYKMLGGNCVPDDMPEDCDPAIQQCDEDGKPVCDCCTNLKQLVSDNRTMINNDNRIISLTENMTSNQNTIITNTQNINNNISNVNNNLTNINESIQNVITTIEENKPDFDTSGIEAKLQELIDKETTVDGTNIEMDFTPLITKLDELNESIKANKYDDTELKAKIDELINKDLSEITDRQDEQTSLLEDIKRLLMPTNEAGDSSFDMPDVEQSTVDPWGALTGFDISRNRINASKQCPADKTFTVWGAEFAIPMQPMCSFLGYLAPVFLMLAYFQGAMIILRSGD
ncbi:virulence factor TspB C-terminal domain-related protein [Psychrobacter aestuarii]|nr:virulence factor TspB C-terminal domain-related protein [Psychrobacter aestuarii]